MKNIKLDIFNLHFNSFKTLLFTFTKLQQLIKLYSKDSLFIK